MMEAEIHTAVIRNSRYCVLALAAVLVFTAACSRMAQKDAPLTAEGKAYVRSLALSDVEMKATESYAKQVLTEIEGNVRNAGDRTVDRVEVTAYFYDRYNQLVLRERVPIIKKTFKPGESRRFRLAFDDIPDTWNNQMPQLVIAQVIFD